MTRKEVFLEELTVAQANPENARALWEVAESAYKKGSPWSVKDFEEIIAAGNAIILRALLPNGETVSFVIASQTMIELDIYMVASKKDYQGQGIAQQLFEKLIADFRAKGLENIFLEVRESNLPAYHLYRKLGFQSIGRRKAYYSEPKEDALMMKFDL